MMKLLMGTHAEVREYLLDYLEGVQPVFKRIQFRLHLLLCRDCLDYLTRYNTAVKLAQNYLDDPPPPELVDLTLRFVRERAERKPDPMGEPEPSGAP